jgi:integrase
MSVRKRKWTTRSGELREAWQVDYTDAKGERHAETFTKKRDADARHDAVRKGVREGTHTVVDKTVTFAKIAESYLEYIEAEGRERTTITGYRTHINKHLNPLIGAEKLAHITAARIEEVRDELVKTMSRPMARKVLQTIKAVLAYAHRKHKVAQNVALSTKVTKDKRTEGRKLEVGVDIPLPAEIEAIIRSAKGRWKPLILTAAFTGLRASELRGLRWQDVNLKTGEISVRQRADIHNKIGAPKSVTSVRTFVMRPHVVATLREWKLACPPGELVFPNNSGNIESLSNIIQRGYDVAQVAAGVTAQKTDKSSNIILDQDGNPVIVARYNFHALRHFFASYLINRRVDGGLELPPKIVQDRLGHSTITMTMDRYGHLFPTNGDDTAMTDIERSLMGRTH